MKKIVKKNRKKIVQIFVWSKKHLRILLPMFAVFIVTVGLIVQFWGGISKGATFGWIQTTWIGGADTTNSPTHTSNRTGWTKFYSKDDTMDMTTVPGDMKISTPTVTTNTQTTDTDFNAAGWDKTTVYVNGTGTAASLVPLKQPGASCSAASECASGVCTASVCTSKWLSGACAGINVMNVDLATTYAWGTGSGCISPQCNELKLVADNNIDFSAYPARNACKAVGGRLPTIGELSCIYTNRANYGNNFQNNGYWSNEERNTNDVAFYWNFSGGYSSNSNNSSVLRVRCVKNQ